MVIVSPALADANNGNWQTARRWQQMLASRHSARIVRSWPDEAAKCDQIMLALHARKSAPAVQAWRAQHGPHRLAVVLTGTDLYRDIATDADAAASLEQAQRLVVLQDLATESLPRSHRAKTRVIYQSTGSRQTLAKTNRHLRALMVGHLRDEKDPLTFMDAARLLGDVPGIYLDHIGAPLDASLAQAARATAKACPRYRWLGALSHASTLGHIQRAHVLVHPSRMEGGAHVVMEAVRAGTPVLASRIPGNLGMLGADYGGYFEVGDAQGLAALLTRCQMALQMQAAPSNHVGLLEHLRTQCALRAPLFDPETERQALLSLIDELLNT